MDLYEEEISNKLNLNEVNNFNIFIRNLVLEPRWNFNVSYPALTSIKNMLGLNKKPSLAYDSYSDTNLNFKYLQYLFLIGTNGIKSDLQINVDGWIKSISPILKNDLPTKTEFDGFFHMQASQKNIRFKTEYPVPSIMPDWKELLYNSSLESHFNYEFFTEINKNEKHHYVSISAILEYIFNVDLETNENEYEYIKPKVNIKLTKLLGTDEAFKIWGKTKSLV